MKDICRGILSFRNVMGTNLKRDVSVLCYAVIIWPGDENCLRSSYVDKNKTFVYSRSAPPILALGVSVPFLRAAVLFAFVL